MDPNNKKDEEESDNSPTELFSSVQVVGLAAKSSVSGGFDKVDKAKTASAADDLLHAAEKYGKLENTSYGQYIDKAEVYLHQYSGKTPETHEKPADEEKPAPPPAKEEEKKEESSGGFGGVMKMAQGFLK